MCDTLTDLARILPDQGRQSLVLHQPVSRSPTHWLTHSIAHSLTHSHCIILLTLTALTSPPILPLTDDAQASQVTVEKSSHTAMKGKSSLSPEMDKLKICKEDFEASKVSFQQVRVVMWCSIRCTCTKILECGISDWIVLNEIILDCLLSLVLFILFLKFLPFTVSAEAFLLLFVFASYYTQYKHPYSHYTC